MITKFDQNRGQLKYYIMKQRLDNYNIIDFDERFILQV